MFDHNAHATFDGKTYEETIGPDLLDKLDEYAIHGNGSGGHFFSALIEGRLFDAVAHADDKILANLRPLCLYIWNHMPGQCHGNPAKVKAWREKGGLIGDGYMLSTAGRWLKALDLNRHMFHVSHADYDVTPTDVVKVYSHQEACPSQVEK